MVVRKAEKKDIDAICVIIDEAKALLKSRGINQWQNGYPNREVVEEDIQQGIAYVADDGEVCGFCVVVFGEDPNYQTILDGEWKNSKEYAAVHRVCVSERIRGKGTAGELFHFAQEFCEKNGLRDIKIDTHPQNMAMQSALKKFGFEYCGKIHLVSPLERGAERYAYQKSF